MYSSLFNQDDREDVVQELLLFYLKRFYHIPDVDEALVVHALKQYASVLIRGKYRKKDFLNSSFDDLYQSNEDFFVSDRLNFDNSIIFTEILNIANEREKQVIAMVMEGYSLNDISKKLHIHKTTIQKFFEKIRNKVNRF